MLRDLIEILALPTELITAVALPILLVIGLAIKRAGLSWITFTVEGVLYWLSRLVKHSLAGKLTLKKYCRLRLAEDNKYLHVPARHDVKLEIDTVFVTLALEEARGGSSNSYNHRDLLSAGNRIRVIGDPGSGKSSLVKRLFRDECQKAIEQPAKARLPITVDLKNVPAPEAGAAKTQEDWLFEYIAGLVSKSKVYQIDEC